MPQPLRSSGDVPRYDTYPAPAANDIPNEIQEDRSRLLLPEDDDHGNDGRGSNESLREGLNTTAQKLGTVVGAAVDTVRNLPQRLQAVPQRIQEMKERLLDASGEMRHDAADAAGELKASAEQRLRQTRRQARQFAYEKPFQVIAIAAGAAFCAGVALRIWRSSLE